MGSDFLFIVSIYSHYQLKGLMSLLAIFLISDIKSQEKAVVDYKHKRLWY